MREIFFTPLFAFFSLSEKFSRLTQQNQHHFLHLYNQENIVIFTYHRWIQVWLLALRHIPVFVLISPGFDGDLATNAVNYICPAWTPLKTNYLSLLRLKKQNTPLCLLLAVDGPSGPLFSVPISAIQLAQFLRAPILLTGVSFYRSISLCSWDRIELALPIISRTTLIWDKPFSQHLEKKSSTNSHLLNCRTNIRRKLISLSQKAKMFWK